MEKLEIFIDPDFTFKIDDSCISALWDFYFNYYNIFDEEFNIIWNDKFVKLNEESNTLGETINFDGHSKIKIGNASWFEFWEELQSPDHILLVVYDIFVETDNSAVSSNFSYVVYYLLNTEKVTEKLSEDFQANEAWIKQKFQVKSRPKFI